MVRNDGSRTNEAAFWDKFASIYGKKARADEPLFVDFYANEFNRAQSICGHDPRTAEIVRSLQKRGYRVVLATNPIFPRIATENRIRWAGLEPDDFALITTYENSTYCKPNPAYYREILEKLGRKAEECLMVGNDVVEDGAAQRLGIPVFFLTPCLINTQGKDISAIPHGGFDELAAYLDQLN